MAEVLAMDLLHHDSLSALKPKRDSLHSSGRGGSGNIRRSFWTSTLDLLSPRDRQTSSGASGPPPTEHHDVPRKHLSSSGRGGSGNIQPLTCDLEAHPLTAHIIQEHNALEAQYEQWVRKVHAESNVIRSSGRGGSGNISNPRRRCSAQELGTSTRKKRFFTTKGRERASLEGAQAQDGQSIRSDKRASRATYSSGGSSLFGALFSLAEEHPMGMGDVVTSSVSVIVDPCTGEDALSGASPRRGNLITRWGRRPLSAASSTLSRPTSPRSPASLLTAPTSPRSTVTDLSQESLPRASTSSASVILEHDEYESFLDF